MKIIIIISLLLSISIENYIRIEKHKKYDLYRLEILDTCINNLIIEKLDYILRYSSIEDRSLIIYIKNIKNSYMIKVVSNNNKLFNPLERNEALGFLEYDIPVFIFSESKKYPPFFKKTNIIKEFIFLEKENNKKEKTPPPPPFYDPIIWNYLYENKELKSISTSIDVDNKKGTLPKER